jgi:hypothetical protein
MPVLSGLQWYLLAAYFCGNAVYYSHAFECGKFPMRNT